MTHRCRVKFAFRLTLRALTAILILAGALPAAAQNIKLRSHLDPLASSQNRSKYADITADGNLAVMGSYSARGGFVFDVSNPSAPFMRAHYNPGNNQQFLEAVIVGTRAYFGSGNGGGVHIVDLSNPSSPVLLGTVNATNANAFNSVHEIVVDGDYLYENLNSLTDRRIKVIDVSNPAQPRFVRDIVPNELRWIHAVHIRNGRMYTSGWGNSTAQPGLTEIYDITSIETEAPRLLGQVASGTNTHSAWTSEDGNWLYVCRELFDGELKVYDIRNPANPLLVKTIKAADLGINAICPHNPMVKGNLLYVAWYQAGVQVFDISNPADPRRVGQYDTFSPDFDVVAAREEADSLAVEPWDVICGAAALANNALPTSYDGNWTAFPLLGNDKVLLSDLATGLYVIDASRATAAPKNTVADFDGDGKTDFSRFSKTSGAWTIENSSNGATRATQFGLSTDKLVPADYDGDGRTDIAVFRDGNWFIINSQNSSFRAAPFGQTGDVPVTGDYDADGKTDLAVFRPSNGVWYIARSTLGFYGVQWGAAGDEPVAGDYDGDGKTDVAVVRESGGSKVWYVLTSSSNALKAAAFGFADDKTLVGDFDGDRKTDFAVFRPSNGTWYVLNNQTNTISGIPFGLASDAPIPADYDGDGQTDVAVYRPSNGIWYGLNSANGAFFAKQFGSANELPAPCAAQPAINTGCAVP